MNLKQYISTFPNGSMRSAEIARISEKLKVSKSYLRGIISGIHPFPFRFALHIEELTKGKIPVHESCPKLYPKPYKWR